MKTHLLLMFAAVALLSNSALADDHDTDAERTVDQPPLQHTVERQDLTLRATVAGRLEAGATHRLRLRPEAYNGPFHVEYVELRSGQVSMGDAILRIDATRIDEAIKAAERQLADQQRRLEHAKKELPVMTQRHATQLKQHEIAFNRARIDLDLWNSYRGPAMLKSAELSLRSMENFVNNQREELEQLEKMYEGTELDSETKEIVLERARRSYAIALERLVLTQNDHLITTEFTHPHRTEDVHNDVEYREQALAHLQINNAIALARKRAEIETLETSIDETQLRLSRLQGDREQFVMRAPATGLMTNIDLHTGDAVNARQVVATIHDPSQKMLRVELTAADLRVLSEGDAIDLHVPEYPELALTGTIESISPIGRARGDETIFDAEVHVVSENPLLRLGLRITGRAERTLEDVLAIPRKAITERDGRFFVTIDADDEHQEREIIIGPGNEKKAQVVRGLDEGDQIVLPEKE